MKILNPATGELIRELPEHSREQIDGKLSAARVKQKSWARKPIEERIECIRRFHELLQKNEEILARDLTLEVGKPIQEAHNELNGARTRIRFFLEKSAETLKPVHVRTDGNTEEWL
ncbi:aldehyde dehydrogenase family protein, partial [bacterium]|nr:aldehyde dehydrogenase family protein [bacterium]